MGFFSKILDKLGMGDRDAAAGTTAATSTPAQSAPAAPRPATPAGAPPSPGTAPKAPPGDAASQQPQAASMVDVVSQLEQRAAASSQQLNWRTSIVDLLKLLDVDSGLEARKSLAKELGAPNDVMDDSAKMNVWLHKTVLERIAANGGNVPKELLD
jgi:hypothetical protein